jgi:AcrR family transcriptional regulator
MASSPAADSPAQRLLDTAATLFVREGIRAVGIDRLIADAKVARASLYQSFGSKDGLIAAYLDRQDELDRAAWNRAASKVDDPVDKLLLLFDLATSASRKRRYRGCLYLNAATEFPDPDHPACQAIARHRDWMHELLVTLLTEAGIAPAHEGAKTIQVLYDGALAGSKFSKSPAPIQHAKELARRYLAEQGIATPSPQ